MELLFTCTAGTFLKAANKVAPIVVSNTVLPIIENIHVQVKGQKAILTATNLDVTAQTEVELLYQVNRTASYSFMMPPLILKVLKNLDVRTIVEFSANDRLTEICVSTPDKKTVTVPVDKSENFPAHGIDRLNLMDNVVINNPKAFLDKILNAGVFACKDAMRPAMQGIYIDSTNITTTDGHRLFTAKHGIENLPVKDAWIMSIFLIKAMQTLDTSKPWKLHLNVGYKYTCISDGFDSTIYSVNIDARFPDYKLVIPKDQPIKISTHRDNFISNLKHAIICSYRTTNQVVIEYFNDTYTMTGSDIDFGHETKSEGVCDFKSAHAFTHALNAKYTLEVLPMLPEKFTINLSTPQKAVTLDMPDGLILIMPLMLEQKVEPVKKTETPKPEAPKTAEAKKKVILAAVDYI